MYSLLLAIIYISFISLGLPDSLLGSAWPVVHQELNVDSSYAGIITIIIALGTVVSSLMSDRLTTKFGAGTVTAVSTLMTAAALFGFSVSNSFILLCILSIPYGLGAGAVDAALNNYVALHYASRHMNWLHCCWGVGAAISPYIMSSCLTGGLGWHSGYFWVAVIQITLTAILFISLTMWKKGTDESVDQEDNHKPLGLVAAVKIPGVWLVLVTFCAYCALEQTAGLWASSYLVQHRGIEVGTAAGFASLYYLGITFGRFLSGFISDKLGDKAMIRIGILTATFGIILVALPLKTDIFALSGLVITGLGSAPIYPAVIHSTPSNFGKDNSGAIIGIQMASAYSGIVLAPPLFGFIAAHIGIGLFPIYLMIFALLMLIMSESLNKMKKQ